MLTSKHGLVKSIQFALEGLTAEFVKGRNFRIQIGLGALAILLGFVLKLTSVEWLGLIIVISSVLILELINTAIEAIVDLVSPEIQPKAKLAKDVAAASVLLASIASVIAGVLLFLGKILAYLK